MPSPISRTHINPKEVGSNNINHTLLASTCNQTRSLWILGTEAETARTAMTNLGLEPLPVGSADKEKSWQIMSGVPTCKLSSPASNGEKII